MNANINIFFDIAKKSSQSQSVIRQTIVFKKVFFKFDLSVFVSRP